MQLPKRNKNKPSSRARKNISTIHVPLGIYGIVIWFFVSLTVIATISMFIWGNVPVSKAQVSEDHEYNLAGMFAAIPDIANSIGFTHGESDQRAQQLERFLISQGSPLAGHAETFVRVADACPMDWALMPAIAGKESAYGLLIPPGSHNAFGWAIYTGQNSGAAFQNWDHAIEVVGNGLCENYIKQGRTTPAQIEQLYTPLSAQTHGGWRAHVTRLMDQIKNWD